jgi:hypothetical protein
VTPALPAVVSGLAPHPVGEPNPGSPEIASRPMSPEKIAAEARRLRAMLAREVHDALPRDPATVRRTITLAQAMLVSQRIQIKRPQILVVVDRAPRAQTLTLVVAQPVGRWRVIGRSRVSTGQANRHGYFITPSGVFVHDGVILDYRAEGTFNEHHIRGLGLKGMRVWDFGWQWAQKGWMTSDAKGQIRLEMHATDPQYLEQRLGRPASEGCVRIPADMNRFLDRHGILDADYEREVAFDPSVRALLLPDRDPTPLAGDKLVIVDSSNGS